MTITEDDRRAAESEAGKIWLANNDVLCERDRELIEQGLVQAFAAHREASERRALERAAAVADEIERDNRGFPGEQYAQYTARIIASAIRALGGE